MNELGPLNLLFSSQEHHALMQRRGQVACIAEVTDGSQEAKLTQQIDSIIRSPTSTLANDEFLSKNDAATLAAAYRARIALAAAASPVSTSGPSNQLRATPAARLLTFVNSPLPTPTIHGSDQNTVQVLEKKWRTLYSSMKSNSQAAADVLMKQAQATSQLEELAQALFMQLKAGSEDRARLQQQLLQERVQLMAQVEEAQQLQQRLHNSEHKSTAVQVVTESLQGQLTQARDALEVSNKERHHLAEQVKQLTEELAVATECRTRGDALIAEQTAAINALKQQLQEQASTMSSLAEDKAQLEAQLQGVLQAEQELTVHLRETHAAIEGQLAALREQLKTERQKRAAVVKRRGELQAQVDQLQAQLAAQQADMAALTDKLIRGGLSHLASSRAVLPHPTLSSTTKPAAQAVLQSQPSNIGGAVHTAQGRVTAAASVQSAPAAPQRSRSTLRPGHINPKVTSQSPTSSSGAGASRLPGQRRPSSPPRSEDITVPSNAPTAAFHVPSSLPSPEASFAVTLSAPTAPGSVQKHPSENVNDSHIVTPVASGPVHTTTVVLAGAAIEPPSPPIALISAREKMGLHVEPGSTGPSRRKSVSPEASRSSMNATQHARRIGTTAGRAVSSRATSPSLTAGNREHTWLP